MYAIGCTSALCVCVIVIIISALFLSFQQLYIIFCCLCSAYILFLSCLNFIILRYSSRDFHVFCFIFCHLFLILHAHFFPLFSILSLAFAWHTFANNKVHILHYILKLDDKIMSVGNYWSFCLFIHSTISCSLSVSFTFARWLCHSISSYILIWRWVLFAELTQISSVLLYSIKWTNKGEHTLTTAVFVCMDKRTIANDVVFYFKPNMHI